MTVRACDVRIDRSVTVAAGRGPIVTRTRATRVGESSRTCHHWPRAPCVEPEEYDVLGLRSKTTSGERSACTGGGASAYACEVDALTPRMPVHTTWVCQRASSPYSRWSCST